MEVAPRVVDAVALAQRVEIVSLPGVHLASQREAVQHAAQGPDHSPGPLRRQARKLMIQESDVECCVVDHEFSARNEPQELCRDLRESRPALEVGAPDTVNLLGTLLDIPIRVEVAMEGLSGHPAMQHLDAADLDDAVTQLRFQSRGLRVEDDLSHEIKFNAVRGDA